MAGRVEQIWIKRAKRSVMDAAPKAQLRADKGIVGNANQGGRRQVTILEKERWEGHMRALNATLDPSRRRANIFVSGFDLTNSRHKVLKIGNVRFRIAGETKPCERMDEALPGLQAVMRPDWGGGAFAVVVDDGEIAVGDTIEWVLDDASLAAPPRILNATANSSSTKTSAQLNVFERSVKPTLLIALVLLIAILVGASASNRSLYLVTLLVALFAVIVVYSLLDHFPRALSRKPPSR